MGKKEGSKNNRKIDKKTWILVGLATVALAIVVVLIINFSQNEKYDSAYFHDDDKKIVLTMDRNTASLDSSVYEPNISHIVYYYEGDKITGVKAFYEYATDDEAKTAYENLGLGEFADSKKLAGRFIVFQVKKSQYEDMTVESLRRNIELLKDINALILDYEDGYIDNYGILNFGADEESEESEDLEESEGEQDTEESE